MSDLKSTILAELEKLRREHYESDDSWYSCPKSGDGMQSEVPLEDRECNPDTCGADEHNARLNKLIVLIHKCQISEAAPLGLPCHKPYNRYSNRG